jgi:uncharacterized protein YceK
MMRKLGNYGLVLAAGLTIFCCAGCGTLVARYAAPHWRPPEQPSMPRIYGGTLFDLRCFFRPEMYRTRGLGGFCLIDAPFSVLADTLILPLTVYEQVRYGSYSADTPVDKGK